MPFAMSHVCVPPLVLSPVQIQLAALNVVLLLPVAADSAEQNGRSLFCSMRSMLPQF